MFAHSLSLYTGHIPYPVKLSGYVYDHNIFYITDANNLLYLLQLFLKANFKFCLINEIVKIPLKICPHAASFSCLLPWRDPSLNLVGIVAMQALAQDILCETLELGVFGN